MSRRKNPSSVDIQKVLLDMREYRMGLIQTPDQLRFSYMAVIEGARLVVANNAEAQVALSPLQLFRKNEFGMNLTSWMSSTAGQTGSSTMEPLTLWAETKFTKGLNWTERAGKAVGLEYFIFFKTLQHCLCALGPAWPSFKSPVVRKSQCFYQKNPKPFLHVKICFSVIQRWKKHSLLDVALSAEHTEGGSWRGTTSSSTTSSQTSPEGREAQRSTAPPPGVTEHRRSPVAGRRASESGWKHCREFWKVSENISRSSVCSFFCFLVSHL